MTVTETGQSLAERIREDMKAALKAREKERLGAIRLILAAIKQREVDERKTLSNEQVVALLDKMVKQRRESVAHYEKAGRDDLVDAENFEIKVLQHYLPEALAEDEIRELIEAAIQETAATSMKDMGKVIGILRPKLQGRADMAVVSTQVKARLSSH